MRLFQFNIALRNRGIGLSPGWLQFGFWVHFLGIWIRFNGWFLRADGKPAEKATPTRTAAPPVGFFKSTYTVLCVSISDPHPVSQLTIDTFTCVQYAILIKIKLTVFLTLPFR